MGEIKQLLMPEKLAGGEDLTWEELCKKGNIIIAHFFDSGVNILYNIIIFKIWNINLTKNCDTTIMQAGEETMHDVKELKSSSILEGSQYLYEFSIVAVTNLSQT